jgi:hypothetical protein
MRRMSTGVAAPCMRRNRAAAPTGRRRGGILSEEGEGIEPVPSEEEERDSSVKAAHRTDPINSIPLDTYTNRNTDA